MERAPVSGNPGGRHRGRWPSARGTRPPGQAGDVRTIAQTAPRACATFADTAQHADNARQIDPVLPDSGEQLWLVYLAHVGTTATDCVALEHATTADEILAAVKALSTPGSVAAYTFTWAYVSSRTAWC